MVTRQEITTLRLVIGRDHPRLHHSLDSMHSLLTQKPQLGRLHHEEQHPLGPS